MGSINWTRLLVILLTILVALVLCAAVLWVASHFISEILLFVIAAILAYLLTPLVRQAQARLRLPRPLAILAVYVAVGAVIVGLGSLVAPAVVEQARTLQARLPTLVAELNGRLAELAHLLRLNGVTVTAPEVAKNAAGALGGVGPALLQSIINIASSIGAGLLNIGLVLVITFYLINDSDAISHVLEGIVPERYAPSVAFATRSASGIIGRYIRAQLAVAAMVALLGGVGAAILGVQYAPLIALFAFLAESIPVLGPIIATVPAVLIATLDSPWQGVAMLIWFIIVQQLEQNVIMPRLSGHAVGIHPVVAIMAILVGFEVGSIWGALFAVPLVGYVAALAREGRRMYVAARASEGGAAPDHAQHPPSEAPRASGPRVEVPVEQTR